MTGDIGCPMVPAGEDVRVVPVSLASAFVDLLEAPTTLPVFGTETGQRALPGRHLQPGDWGYPRLARRDAR